VHFFHRHFLIFLPLDPDSQYGSGSTKSLNPDPIQIHNPGFSINKKSIFHLCRGLIRQNKKERRKEGAILLRKPKGGILLPRLFFCCLRNPPRVVCVFFLTGYFGLFEKVILCSLFAVADIDRRVAELTARSATNQYQCLECGKVASQRTDLKKHIEAAHLQLALPCHLCGQIFKTRHGRQTHRRVQHGLRETSSGGGGPQPL
jgi:uncharacterized C2H2 Zn-finger protein